MPNVLKRLPRTCLALALGSLPALAACDRPTAATPAAEVEVRSDSTRVEVGGTLRLTAVVKGAGGAELAGRRVEWQSSAPATAAVEDGVVRGLAPGRATITATSGSASGSLEVSVEPVVGSLELSPFTTTLAVGVAAQVSVSVRSPSGEALQGVTLRWSTGDPAVAAADSGRVRGVGPGTTEVVVQAGSRTARFTLRVMNPYTITRIVFPGETANRAVAINGRGLVVGTATVAGGRTEAWAWQMGTLMPLGEGRALDVNDRGEVVGASGADAVMWANGGRTVLFSRPGGSAVARAANVHGEVAGDWRSSLACGSGGRCEGTVFLYSGGAAREIVAPTTNATGYGISDLGWVVGTTGSEAHRAMYSFVYRDGALTQLPGQDGTQAARAVNARGEIVGGGGYSPALLWTGPEAAAAPLPPPAPGTYSSVAAGVNELGVAVGQWLDRGMVWRDGKGMELNFLHTDPDWTVEHAADVDLHGVIVGHGRHRVTGQTAALLLSPPSP